MLGQTISHYRVLEKLGGHVAADSQLWGRQYNRKFSEIITVQEEIAKEVSEKLRLRPTARTRFWRKIGMLSPIERPGTASENSPTQRCIPLRLQQHDVLLLIGHA